MPRIGLLSDSHGRAEITRQAVQLLVDQGAQTLIHLGDLCAPAVVDALVVDASAAGSLRRSHMVAGNMDMNVGPLLRYAAELGIEAAADLGLIDLPDGPLMYTHGHLTGVVQRAMVARPRYLCHGHTHEQRDEMIDAVRVINPGALYRAKQYSVALLDTEADNLVFHVVRQVC